MLFSLVLFFFVSVKLTHFFVIFHNALFMLRPGLKVKGDFCNQSKKGSPHWQCKVPVIKLILKVKGETKIKYSRQNIHLCF